MSKFTDESTHYFGPWGIDQRHPYGDAIWSIVNSDTGRTKKIGPSTGRGFNWFDRAKEVIAERNQKTIEGYILKDRAAIAVLIDAVRDLDLAGWEKFKPYDHDHSANFALWRCVRCAGPVFQYPCPLCFWGPEESSMREHEASYKRATELREQGINLTLFEDFKHRISKHYDSKYAPFYFSYNKATVAYNNSLKYVEMTDWLIEQAPNIKQPNLAVVWRFVGQAHLTHTTAKSEVAT